MTGQPGKGVTHNDPDKSAEDISAKPHNQGEHRQGVHDMAQLTFGVPPDNAVLAIFYDINGDIIQIDPMGGTLIDANDEPVEIVSSQTTKLKAMTTPNLCATKQQTLLRQDPTPSTMVTPVRVNPDCLWVEHGGRNVWRCP